MTLSTSDGSLILEATYSYSQTVFPAEGNGKISGRSMSRIETVPIAIRQVDVNDAPIAASLNYGFGEDACLIDVRLTDEGYCRSLMAPGARRRCNVETLTEALRGDVTWVDDPFTHRPEYRRERNKRVREERAWDFGGIRKWGESHRAHDEAAFLAKTRNLLIIGSEVYVRCEAPFLVMKHVDHRAWLTFAINDVKSEGGFRKFKTSSLEGDDDETLGPTTIYPTNSDYRLGDPGLRKNFTGESWRCFALRAIDEARDFLNGHASDAFKVEDRDLVAYMNPELLPEPTSLVPTKEAMRGILKSMLSDIEWMPRTMVEQWLDARDIATSDENGLGIPEAMNLLVPLWAAVREKQTSRYWHASSFNETMLRWATVDSKLMPEPSRDQDLSGLSL